MNIIGITTGSLAKRKCEGTAVAIVLSGLLFVAGDFLMAQQQPSMAPRQTARLDSTPSPMGAVSTVNGASGAEEFVIGNEDVLNVSVWKEAELSRSVPVRSDGKISLPLIGELQASGKTPKQLQAEITAGLQPFIPDPAVTVMVQEIRSKKFNILGQVQKPGAYPLTPPMRVVDAIAMAGGLKDFAKMKDIYVLRRAPSGADQRLAFNYKQVIRGNHSEQNVRLEPGDTVVVP